MGMLITCPQCGSIHYTEILLDKQCDRILRNCVCSDCGTEFEVTYMAEKVRRIESCWTVIDEEDGTIVVVARTLESALRYMRQSGFIENDSKVYCGGSLDTIESYIGPLEDNDTIQELAELIENDDIELYYQFQKMEIWDS